MEDDQSIDDIKKELDVIEDEKKILDEKRRALIDKLVSKIKGKYKQLYVLYSESKDKCRCSYDVGLFSTYERANNILRTYSNNSTWMYHIMIRDIDKFSKNELLSLDKDHRIQQSENRLYL